MRTRLLAPIIVLSLAVAMLTACTSTATPAPNAKLEPATLQGQSEHWKVNVNYMVKDKALEEVATIQYLTMEEEITEASVTIMHQGKAALTYHVDNPELLKGGQAISLAERAKVASWKDTEKISIEWKIADRKFTEYITPSQKTPAATP